MSQTQRQRPQAQPVIYGLVDPRDGQLRYVGQTTRPLDWRLGIHVSPSQTKLDRPKCRWVREVLAAGRVPEIVAIEHLASTADLHAAEQHWIGYFRSIGADLTNLAAGGPGSTGWHRSAPLTERLAARHRKPVVDDLGNVYASESDAAKRIGGTVQDVSACIHGRRRTTRGRTFRFLEA